MKVLVVDDELLARHRLIGLLSKYRPEDETIEADTGLKAVKAIVNEEPDLIFLDIQLKDMTGFEVVQKTFPGYRGNIIFVTAYDSYALRAFEINAIDYLLKPFSENRFLESLQRVQYKGADLESLIHFFNQKYSEKTPLIINDGTVNHYFQIDRLIYIKSDRYYNKFFTDEKPVLVRSSLKDLLNVLPKNFIKINRSVIINSGKVKLAKRTKRTIEIHMENGASFQTTQISKSLLSQLRFSK